MFVSLKYSIRGVPLFSFLCSNFIFCCNTETFSIFDFHFDMIIIYKCIVIKACIYLSFCKGIVTFYVF